MRKTLLALALVGVLAAPAAAAPAVHHGSFVQVFQKPGQRHRVYLQVESTNHGDKHCDVTLHARTQEVDLSQGKSDLFNMFFLKVRGATAAFNQAKAAPSPTNLIDCSH